MCSDCGVVLIFKCFYTTEHFYAKKLDLQAILQRVILKVCLLVVVLLERLLSILKIIKVLQNKILAE